MNKLLTLNSTFFRILIKENNRKPENFDMKILNSAIGSLNFSNLRLKV
jgi:hypothetical protein